MNELTIEQAQLADLREILRQFDASCAKGPMGDSGDILLRLEEWGPVSIARLAIALDAQLQQERGERAAAEALAEESNGLQMWLAGSDSGASSKSLVLAHLGLLPRYGWHDPLDSYDFGRCYRLIRLFPDVRGAVDVLARVHQGWAALAPIWDELMDLGDESGLSDPAVTSNAIYRRIRDVRLVRGVAVVSFPQAQPGEAL